MSYLHSLRALVGPRPLIIAGAAVLIIDKQNRLLLQHRKDNRQWGLIGGSMEIGESLEDTARREAYEELIYEYPNGDIVVNVVAAYPLNK